MGQTSVGRLHGRLDVLQTLLVAPPSWIQDGGAGNDINQDLGRVFRSLLRGRCKMATLPLPAVILDDLICGTGNEVIQDGRRKRKGRHFAPPPQWGSKNSPYTTVRSDVHAKGQGQRSKVKVTEVNTQLSRFRTLAPVWIDIWQWNLAHSWKQHRRGALLFFKVIRQISRSHGSKNRRIWPRLGVSGL